MITKSEDLYKVKTINANIWCHATYDVGFMRLENFATDLSMKLLATVLCNLGVIWPFLQVIGHISTESGLSIYNIWLNSATGSFLLENSREMKVNAINFSMSIIILSKKVYFRQDSFRFVAFLL